jgi:hypothetical protein
MKTLFLTLFTMLAAFNLSAYGQNGDTNPVNPLATYGDTNFVRSLDSLRKELKPLHDSLTWGMPATNGVQMGVGIFLGDNSRAKKFGVGVYLYKETNEWIGIYPPSGYHLSLSLMDADGNSVKKTEQGKAISKPIGFITKYQIRNNSRTAYFPAGCPQYYEGFYLLDCFKVEKPGTNTLTVGGTLCKWSSGNFNEIPLPPVSILVPITQADINNENELSGKETK